MEKINILELFSGIGGFTKGLQQAGFEIDHHYFSEIDKHAIANYKYNFKNAEYVGSVTDVRGGSIQHPDIITFGSPCQDFSLAGKQLGMEGQRSVLILEAIRLVRECRPSVFIWENVKGAFSSNDGADFWGIIAAFANIGGYRLEWQLLNTSWVLPQNRERIYLVGHLDGRSEPGIFPFTENDFVSENTFAKATGEGQRFQVRNNKAKSLNARMHKMGVDENYVEVIQKTSGQSVTIKNNCTGTLQAGGSNVMDKVPNVQIVAMRGRNPENPTSRESGLPTEQMLEPRLDGNTNCLTSVQKDNLIFTKNYAQWDTSGKGYKSQQDRAFYEDGNMGTIPSGRTENEVNILTEGNIRRLTEIECERLQGFPDNWTEFGDYDGTIKKTPKTQRYKMCGNAVTVDIVELIASRIKLL